MSAASQITIPIPDPDEMMFVTGTNEANIDRIEREFDVKIVSRGAELRISGEPAAVARVGDLVGAMRTLSGRDDNLRKPALDRLIDEAKDAPVAPPERFARAQERGEIEVAPLAFMRGRTLNEAFIILDEAQNTTPQQMKMFLTRLGYGSQAVVNGDITQIDLTGNDRSGLVLARQILSGVPGIGFVDFDERDVVRHELVARIVRAYDKWESVRGDGTSRPGAPAPASESTPGRVLS